MLKIASGIPLFSLILLLTATSARADMIQFDFDGVQAAAKKKGIAAPAIEAYMEGLYGFDVSVSLNTAVVRGRSSTIENALQSLSATAGDGDAYLTPGKGKGSAAITIDFGDNPIESFSVDFQLFKKAKNFAILADGVVIDQHTLAKAQRKAGLTGQTTIYFDEPVQTLQFVGSKKKSIGIDNLVINLSPDLAGGSNPNGSGFFLTTPLAGFSDNESGSNQLIAAEVPEPSALFLLAVGLFAAFGTSVIRVARRSLNCCL